MPATGLAEAFWVADADAEAAFGAADRLRADLDLLLMDSGVGAGRLASNKKPTTGAGRGLRLRIELGATQASGRTGYDYEYQRAGG